MCGLGVQSVDCMGCCSYEDIFSWEPEDPLDPSGPLVRRLMISSQFCWTLCEMVSLHILGKLWVNKKCWLVAYMTSFVTEAAVSFAKK